jgi:uncharacterized membrane protein (UPF0127 family)
MQLKNMFPLNTLIFWKTFEVHQHMLYFVRQRSSPFILLLLIFLVLFSNIYACSKQDQSGIQETVLPLQNEPQFKKEGEVTFFSKINKKIITIDVEMPDTLEETTKGLMYRKTMAETQGMLFVHDTFQARFFWMKNTYISLDMIFVDKTMKVVRIKKNTTPLSEQLISVPEGTYYTIEVNAGFCDRYGIQIEDSIQVLRIP